MKWPRREVQLFSMSFLDLFACALGGVLLVWIVTMSSSSQKIASSEEIIQVQIGTIEIQHGSIEEQDIQIDEQGNRIRDLTRENTRLAKAMTGVIGLKGKMRNIVFVFDTSESMKDKLSDYQLLLQGWIGNLDFEKFNVISFGEEVKSWKPGLQAGSDANRKDAGVDIGAFEPRGNTNTLDALKKAFKNEGVDTIVLFSDGAPSPRSNRPQSFVDTVRVQRSKEFAILNDSEKQQKLTSLWAMQEVMDWLKTMKNKNVAINTIGMGDYFNQDYGEFLRDIARDNKGEFIGR